MSEQLSFYPDSPEELHLKVAKELGRIIGEDWEDFNEVVRYEVNERLKEQRSNKPKPDYKHSKIIYT
jgi:hypothetical protein